MIPARVLVVDDNTAFVEALGRALRGSGRVLPAGCVEEARRRIAEAEVGVVDVVLDEAKGAADRSGLDFVAWAVEHHPDVPLIVLTGYGDDQVEVEALRLGAADYIEKENLNFRLLETKLLALLERRALRSKAQALEKRLAEYEPHTLVGQSPAMAAVREQVRQFAQTDGTVFIQGESGVGKEVVARAIHQASRLHDQPFVAVNCASIGQSVSESELFGHERGAFTGAEQQRKGYFEAADGGTLLLDEVTEMEPTLQAKLLRVLQEGRFQRLGSSEEVEVDVRIIATTNRDPAETVRSGKLREDLFHRLNVMPISVPPLREHATDIPLLADHFLRQMAKRLPHARKRFSHDAIELLQQYHWPGNVRELQNLVERACALCGGDQIPSSLIAPWLTPLAAGAWDDQGGTELDFDRARARGALAAVSRALHLSNGVKAKAQELLGFRDLSTMRRNIQVLRDNFPDLWAKFPDLHAAYPPGSKSK